MSLTFRHVYYIKLGRNGCWEADSIARGILRIGWSQQSTEDIRTGQWERIEAQLRAEQPDKPGVATTDLNRLKDIAESSPEDLWITFHGGKLWWTRLEAGPIESDAVSKFRRTAQGWHDCSLNGRLLVVNDLPGRIAMLQGFRGTACQVRDADLLARVLTGARSALAQRIEDGALALTGHLREAIAALHWKDFETLVDLVFRHAGWQRVSVLGQQAKGYDLELREPLIGNRYVVQVKSQAGLADVLHTAAQFAPDDYRKVFFVVHSPAKDLLAGVDIPEHVELVPPARLARLALEAGLVNWLESKVA